MSTIVVWLAPLLVWLGFFILLGGEKREKHLFLWGFCWCFGVSITPLMALVRSVGVYPCGVALLFCALGLALYVGFLAGVFLWIHKRIFCGNVVCGVVLILVFSRFLLYDSLRFFDLGEGVFFLHPLAVCMESPLWREMVVFCGEWGAFCVLLTSVLVGRFLWTKKCFVGFVLFVFLLTMPSNWREPCSRSFRSKYERLVCLPSKAFVPCVPISVADAARHLSFALKEVPKAPVVIFPESAFPVEVAPGTKAFQALESLSIGRGLICGCYWRGNGGNGGNGGVSNAAICFCNGRFKGVYCKRHGVPFVERLPFWGTWPIVRTLFDALLGGDVFVQGGERAPAFVCGDYHFVPLLCSELFSAPIATDVVCDESIIVGMVNDAWWSDTSFTHHLWRIGALRSLVVGKPFLYVSYSSCGVFDGNGGWLKL